MKPVITIDAYEPWMSYLLFEQYKEGYFKGLYVCMNVIGYQARCIGTLMRVGSQTEGRSES
jgi:hypothetical protein